MVASSLTQELITGGENLLKELDAANVSVDAGFWFFYPEHGIWKLMLWIPKVERDGPKAVYGTVQKALSKVQGGGSPTLDDVALLKPNAPLVPLLRSAIRTGPGISGIRFSNNVINGQLIPDAYIYRLT